MNNYFYKMKFEEVFLIPFILLSLNIIFINTEDISTKWEDPFTKTKYDFSSLSRPFKYNFLY